MLRRGLAVTFLALIAVQLLGGVVLAPVCLEACPDDTETTSCPPVCALCTSCTHAQQAIVRHSETSAPLSIEHDIVPQQHASITSSFADEIFHVPLFG
jgi:hypothetical protein